MFGFGYLVVGCIIPELGGGRGLLVFFITCILVFYCCLSEEDVYVLCESCVHLMCRTGCVDLATCTGVDAKRTDVS